MTPDLIEKLAPWSAPKNIVTKRGDRILRTARMTEELEKFYADNRKELLLAGVVRSEFKGKIELTWWQELPAAALQAKEERVAASRATDAEIVIPCPEGLSYRGYQRAGVAFCLESFKQRGGALLADDMGVGKTIQAIAMLNADPKIQRCLIIAPKGLLLNWYRELKKWLTRPMTIGIADPRCFPSTDIILINFEICYKFEKSTSFFWDLVIIDEAHRVKTRTGRAAKAILGFRPTRKESENGEVPSSGIPTRRKLALTGTPIENRPIEIFQILNWIDPMRWKSRSDFAKRYCGANQFNNWNPNGASDTKRLQSELRSTCMIRRLKTDPGILDELPEKQRQLIILPSDGLEHLIKEEREIEERWQAKLAAVKAQAKDPQDYQRTVEALESDESRGMKGDIFRIAHEIGRAKVPLISEHAIEALEEGQKLVLFALHLDVIQAYMDAFKGFRPVRFTGAESPVERQQAVDRFQREDSCRIIVLNEAGREGITLTASSQVLFSELWWTPGRMAQMEDRLCRIGQRNSVLVQHFALQGSMDVRKLQVLIQKEEIIRDALDRRQDGSNCVKQNAKPFKQQPLSQPGFKQPAAKLDCDGRQMLLV